MIKDTDNTIGMPESTVDKAKGFLDGFEK